MDRRIREKTLPVASHSLAGSLERIIALRPDLVIVWSLSQETIAALEERDIPVYGVFIDDLADIYREVLDLGRMTGVDERARQIVAYTQKEILTVRQKISAAKKKDWPRAYFMWAKGELDSGGGPSIVQELLDLAGAVNICGQVDQEHVVVNQENLLVSDPQILIMWFNPLLDPAEVGKNLSSEIYRPRKTTGSMSFPVFLPVICAL